MITTYGVLYTYDVSPAQLRALVRSPGVAVSENIYDGEKLFQVLESGKYEKSYPPEDDCGVNISGEDEHEFASVTLPDGRKASLFLYWPDFCPDMRPDNYDELYPEAYLLDTDDSKEAYYRFFRKSIDGKPFKDIDELFRNLNVSKVNEPTSQVIMDFAPRTDVEEHAFGSSFGGAALDETFTAESKFFRFLVLIHDGLCYTSPFCLDKTTNTFKCYA